MERHLQRSNIKVCYQITVKIITDQTEDCLTINVYTPSVNREFEIFIMYTLNHSLIFLLMYMVCDK